MENEQVRIGQDGQKEVYLSQYGIYAKIAYEAIVHAEQNESEEESSLIERNEDK
jgi:sRNA-binding carbon storage regulator CsrA